MEEKWDDVQDLQPQLIKTVVEVEALMVRIAKEKAEVVQPKAAAVAVDEAAAQAKVKLNFSHAFCRQVPGFWRCCSLSLAEKGDADLCQSTPCCFST